MVAAMALAAAASSAGVGRACCNSVVPGLRSQWKRRSYAAALEEPYDVVSKTGAAWPSVGLNWTRRKQSWIVAAKVSRRRAAVAVGVSAGTAALIAGAVAAAGALAVAATKGSGLPPQQAVLVTRKGMQLFEQAKVRESLEKFDEALELDPRQRPYLWQRGLCLYYLDRFEDGAAQFRDDVAVNPNDTEEALWTFLCEAKLYGPEEARRRFLKVGIDSRPVMRKVYEVYRDGRPVEEILQSVSNPGGADFFYASLYTGLYHEAYGNADAAREAMISAVRSPYGSRSGDYMVSLAKVHCLCRNWASSSAA